MTIRVVSLFFLALATLIPVTSLAQDWRTADRSSMGIAPRPEDESDALVQIYAARAFRWRGYFAVHTWEATKEKNSASSSPYQVITC